MNLTGTTLSNSRGVDITQTKSLYPSSSRVLYSRVSESAGKHIAIMGTSKNFDLNSDLSASASKSERFKSMNQEVRKGSGLTSVA